MYFFKQNLHFKCKGPLRISRTTEEGSVAFYDRRAEPLMVGVQISGVVQIHILSIWNHTSQVKLSIYR